MRRTRQAGTFLAFVVNAATTGRFQEAIELAHAAADVVAGQMESAHSFELRGELAFDLSA